MRSWLISGVLALLMGHCVAQKWVLITGKVMYPRPDSLRFTQLANFIHYESNPIFAAKPDKLGRFSLRIPLSVPSYGELFYNGHMATLYLAPGDSLHVTFDARRFNGSLQFAGRGAAPNQYLLQKFLRFEDEPKIRVFPKMLSDALPHIYQHFADSLHRDRWALLEKWRDKLPAQFQVAEQANLFYQNIVEKLNYPVYQEELNGEKPAYLQTKIPPSYYQFLQDLPTDDAYLHVPGYVNLLSEYPLAAYRWKHQLKMVGAGNYTALYEQVEQAFSGHTRQFVQANLVYESLSFDAWETAKALYHRHLRNDSLGPYQPTVEAQHQRISRLQPGSPAPNFTLLSPNGKKISLSDYRGKVVFLDFWATWCRPCLEEMNHARILKEKLKDKAVVFLYVSLDENAAMWRKTVAQRRIKGEHGLSMPGKAPDVANIYQIVGIPAYFLIGKDGRIIDPQAKRPSDAGLLSDIEAALIEKDE